MNATFDCQIKAIVQSNSDKRPSSTVSFQSSNGKAIFSEEVTVFSNPNLAQTLKITLLIVKANTTKMVGIVNLDIEDDPVATAGLTRYSLDKCPMTEVKLSMTYLLNGKPVPTTAGYSWA